MLIKLKLNEAIELERELKHKLKNNRDEIISCHKGGKIEELNNLVLERMSISNDLVSLKAEIRRANVEEGIASKIYQVGELKTLEEIYTKINHESDKNKVLQSITQLQRDINVSNNLVDVSIEVESNTIKKLAENRYNYEKHSQF